jgi:hypothetical protein
VPGNRVPKRMLTPTRWTDDWSHQPVGVG